MFSEKAHVNYDEVVNNYNNSCQSTTQTFIHIFIEYIRHHGISMSKGRIITVHVLIELLTEL